MTPRLTLVQYPGLDPGTTLSPPCAKVHMALRWKRLTYDVIDLTAPWQVKRYNSRGRVPILLVDGSTVVDSTDILTELDRRFPEPRWTPRDARDATEAKILEDWADEVLYFYGLYLRWCVPENVERMRAVAFGRLPWPARWIVPPLAIREVRRRARGQGVGLKDRATVEREFDECLNAIESLLEGRSWLAGTDPSRADLAVGAVIDQLRILRLTPRVAHRIDARPSLRAWLDRLRTLVPSVAERPPESSPRPD